MYERVGKGLTQAGGERTYNNIEETLGKTNDNSEIDFFPALKKYKEEHNTANLQKLMVEISEFCRSVYASTQNEAERKIYHSMIEKLNKQFQGDGEIYRSFLFVKTYKKYLKKILKKFQKPIDKREKVCYNKDTVRGTPQKRKRYLK